jgi:hypothetical protein
MGSATNLGTVYAHKGFDLASMLLPRPGCLFRFKVNGNILSQGLVTQNWVRDKARGTASLLLIKTFLMALCLMPFLAVAAPTVIVDSVPTGAALFNVATVRLRYRDLDKVDSKEVEAGVASAISNAMQFADSNAVTYICLLSSAGDGARSYTIDAARSRLNLQQRDPSFVMVLYRGGRDTTTTDRITYSLDRADSNRKHVTMTFRMVSVPAEWTPAAWVYFNLSRIQDEALKTGATQVFLLSEGKGITSSVVIPGLKVPLMVFADETTISATWYVQNTSGVEALP